MKSNHTDITLLLDRSGSMASVAEDTIGGVSTFIDEQRKAPGTASFTLHQFDDLFETPIPTTDIQKVPNLTSATFVPRGNTALLDAIGRAIGETGSRLEKTNEADRAGKVVFVIVTDGHENASHEYTPSKVHEMIEHQKTQYSWEFVFIGANQDAIKVATAYGINSANAMTYAANAVGTPKVFMAAASNLRMVRGGQSVNMAWSAAQREEQKKAGA